jgi:hypothetical protein
VTAAYKTLKVKPGLAGSGSGGGGSGSLLIPIGGGVRFESEAGGEGEEVVLEPMVDRPSLSPRTADLEVEVDRCISMT